MIIDDHALNDREMPKEWPRIRSIVLKEMRTCTTFHDVICCADALFHARLLARGVAREMERFDTTQAEACGAPNAEDQPDETD